MLRAKILTPVVISVLILLSLPRLRTWEESVQADSIEGERVALVIGNSAYSRQPLKNPVNDARAISAKLSSLGFQVDLSLDNTLQQMAAAVDSFISKLSSTKTAVFYYSGHGMQIEGENYLIPTDFVPRDEADAKYTTYSASRIVERMEKAKSRINIVILDACRDNPFRSLRSSSKGLAAMRSGRGTYIAFSCALGETADDNPDGPNGLFTTYLLKAFDEKGLDLNQLFDQVREQVAKVSNYNQIPWIASGVIGSFYFNPINVPQGSGTISSSLALVAKQPVTSDPPTRSTSGTIDHGPKDLPGLIYPTNDKKTELQFKAIVVTCNTKDQLSQEISKITDNSGTHVWDNNWYYFRLAENNHLLLVWKDLKSKVVGWVLVQRSDGNWWYKTNDDQWKNLSVGNSKSENWRIGETRIVIELEVPTPVNGWTQNDIKYRFSQ